ncbi:MAG: SUMF1/EgtB/PvdO family nonheme iron enzyme [Hylemonella sp.]|nr:SUMF1/EgtB/PvdO family nonheme iron enzyme [Hylemonella sp.]
MKPDNRPVFRYLCTLGALLLGLHAHAAKLALVVGNDAYSQIEPLKNARNDARLIAGVLRNAGFEVTEASNLNRTALWSTLDQFKGRINKGDEVVFYFAGHGVQIGANQLLLPTDITAQNDAQIQRDGVPLLDVQDALKDARIAMLLIDACRDNPFPKTGTRAIGGTRGLAPPEAATGQIIMMSAGRNQKALDRVPDSSQPNGLFAWELSQELQKPGVEIRSALEDVKNRVDDKARRAGHEQRPSLVNDLRGPYTLMGGPSVQVASLRAEPVPPSPAPLARVQPVQTSAGQTIKDCADCPELVVLPGGSFQMGSNDSESRDDEKPVHGVNVKSFAVGKYEVTLGQWQAVMGSHSRYVFCTDDCPIEGVSWNDIQDYIKKLSQKTGQTYRLPTEAEWEYACRGGKQQKYCGSDDVNAVAWYDKNGDKKPHPVGQKAANGFGLHDMSGSVYEWVQDGWHSNYQGAPSDGSEWTAGADASHRVLRGGNVNLNARNSRAADRNFHTPDVRAGSHGFRLARTIP